MILLVRGFHRKEAWAGERKTKEKDPTSAEGTFTGVPFIDKERTDGPVGRLLSVRNPNSQSNVKRGKGV